MKPNLRIIARLDIKNEYVIKGIHLEGLRKVGDPNTLAKDYYKNGADEILFMDAVASLYERNSLFDIITATTRDVFIPITVGGGLRTLIDIEQALKSGADKVGINTAAVKNPSFIREAAKEFGSQCIVSSIEAKRHGNRYEAYVDNGRESTGIEVFDWLRRIEDLGAGEVLLTSVNKEGTKRGFEIELMKRASEILKIPIIVSGGAGSPSHIKELIDETDVDAIAVASILHYKQYSIREIKRVLLCDKYFVRM